MHLVEVGDDPTSFLVIAMVKYLKFKCLQDDYSENSHLKS